MITDLAAKTEGEFFETNIIDNHANFLLYMPVFSQGSVNVSWDSNSENDLAGYRIYYGTLSRNYDQLVDAGNRITYQINGLSQETRYYFTVTAYDTAGNESAFSDEVSILLATNPSLDTLSSETTLQIAYNFPNPFKLNVQNAQLRYFLNQETTVTIRIFDLNSNLVKIIQEAILKSSGEHTEDFWDGTNSSGELVASGIYFCKIETAEKNKIFRIAAIR